jgi:hypothetical protein
VVAHEDVTDRRRYERERLGSRTREAAARARVREQRRVGRELHDRVAHLMGVVHQSLELHEALKGRDPEKAAEKMALARRATKEAMAATRDLSQALRHTEAGEGLEAALSGLLRETVPPGTAHELSVSGEDGAIPDGVREQLFLVLREAVRNAVRHSGGRRWPCRSAWRGEGSWGPSRTTGGASTLGRSKAGQAGGWPTWPSVPLCWGRLFGGLGAGRGDARGGEPPGRRPRALTSGFPRTPSARSSENPPSTHSGE